MNTKSVSENNEVAATEYISENFVPSDRVAILCEIPGEQKRLSGSLRPRTRLVLIFRLGFGTRM